MRTWIVIAGLVALLQPSAFAQVSAVAPSGTAELRFRFNNTAGAGESVTLDRFLLGGRP